MTGKSYFLLGSPFKLACASLFQRWPAVEPTSGDGLKLICGHQPSALEALIMAADAAVRRDGYRRSA